MGARLFIIHGIRNQLKNSRAMENNTTTIYNSTNEVFLPTGTVAFAVDNRDWNRLKSTVEKCDSKTNLWEVFASVFSGGALSGFFTWLSIRNTEGIEKSSTILLCTAITCFLLAIVCFIASKSFKKQERERIESVKNELKFIEDKRPQMK